MPVIKLKPNAVEMLFYRKLPNPIKHILAGPESGEMATKILQEAGLSEEFRPYLNTVIFGLFVGELNPKDLAQGIKEWLGLEPAKSELVAALVRKVFIEPHKDFLEKIYKNTGPTPPSSPSANQERSNVVNLKQAP